MAEQGSAEWFAERAGKVTASRIADMMARTKTGWGAGRANYLAELVVERLTGCAAESYTNAAMAWGTATEPQARAMYSFVRDIEVEEVGFFDHPRLFAGASPDGLVGADGLVEIKCPSSATHLATLRGEPIADRYIKQMHFQLACTGRRAWCDFVSFDPRFPADLQMHVRRVERDQHLVEAIEDAAEAFLEEVTQAVKDLRPTTTADLRASLDIAERMVATGNWGG